MNTVNEHEPIDSVDDVAPTRSLFAGSNTGSAVDTVATESVEQPDELENGKTPAAEAVEENEMAQPVEEPESSTESVSGEAEEPAPVEEAVADAEAVQTQDSDEQAPLKDLLTKQEKLSAKIAEKQKAERKAVIDQIAVVVKTYNIPITELADALGGVPNPRKGTKAPILFTDGKNNWTGRGKTPNWLKDKNIEDYRVK